MPNEILDLTLITPDGTESVEVQQAVGGVGSSKRMLSNPAPYTFPFPQFTTATSTTAYTGTPSPAITAYATGQKFQVKAHATSTGPVTLNLGSIGAKKVFINPTTQADADHLIINQIYLLFYDEALDSASGGFIMIGGSGGGATGTLEDVLTEDNDGGGLQIKNIANATDPQDATTLSQVQAAIISAVTGLLDYRGGFDASGGAYPTSAAGGSGSAGAVLKADFWIITVAGTLPTGIVVGVGDWVVAKIDTPGNTGSNWTVVEYNIIAASTSTAGIVQLDTDGNIQSNANSGRVVTSGNLAAWWTWVKTQVQTFAAQITFTLSPIVSAWTASTFPVIDASKQIISRTILQFLADLGIDLTRRACSVSSGTMTLDLLSKQQLKFENTTTISSNFTIAFSNSTVTEIFAVHLFITGTVSITMPSSVIAVESETRWNNGTKVLTVLGITASPIEFSFSRINGDKFLMRASTKYYAS